MGFIKDFMVRREAKKVIKEAQKLWIGGSGSKTPRIDIWEMTDSYYSYGYFPDGTETKYPEIIVYIPIVGKKFNCKFKYNPRSLDFFKWLSASVRDTSLFTIEEYNRRFIN